MLRFILISIFIFLVSNSYTNEIIFKGLNRLTTDDLQSLTSNDIYDKNFDEDKINFLIKELYQTDQILDINNEKIGSSYILYINESPVIENIYINGNLYIKDQIILDLLESTKNSFLNKRNIDKDVVMIKNLYKTTGRNQTFVSVSTEKFSEAKINLIFDIKESSPIKISKINIYGNKSFKSKFLISKIKSKQVNNFNIFNKGSNFNQSIFDNDLRILKNYYINKGFPNVEITYQLEENFKNSFSLNFYINENKRISVDKVNFDIPDLISQDDLFIEKKNLLLKKIKQNQSFLDIYLLDDFQIAINDLLINKGFNKSIEYHVNVLDFNSEVNFELIDVEIKTVKELNIYGNSITKTNILLSKIDILPGDFLNYKKIDKSIERLNNLKYVNKANYELFENSDNSVNLNYDIEENKKTGNFLMGGSYNGDIGLGVILSLKDENLFGSGNELQSDITLNGEQSLFSINYSANSIKNNSITNTYSIRNKEIDYSQNFGFSAQEKSIGYTLSLKYDDNTKISTGSSFSNIRGHSPKNSNLAVTDNIGNFDNIVFTFSISQDLTNDFLYPSDGYNNELYIEYSPEFISENSYLKGTYQNNFYYELPDSSNYFFISNKIGLANSLNGSKLKTINSYSLGGLNFKGFDYMGLGSKTSNNTYLGGNKFFTSTIGYGSSFLFDERDNIYFRLFYSTGSLWDSDYIKQDFKIRSSIGASFDILSPIGPISFTYAIPILKETSDVERKFSFSIGTSF